MFTKVDKHGIKELRTWFKLTLIISALITTLVCTGSLLYFIELPSGGSNISSVEDGIWTIFMMISTIGFGDVFPDTIEGRIIGFIGFIIGAIIIGMLFSTINNAMGADRSVQNRELRTMLSEVMRKLEHIEKNTDYEVDVSRHSHNLDVVFEQSEYESADLMDGFLTIGRDSTGIYMMAVCAYARDNSQVIQRWIPADDEEHLREMYKRYLNNYNEL